jgi:uncharacterized protein (TIGR03000 family)
MSANTALIDIKVPPDAQIFFDDAQTRQTGAIRQFITPSLDPSKNFSYIVHARWKEGDRDMDDTRKVTVHAGARLRVDFTSRQESGQRTVPTQERAPQPRQRDSAAPPPPPKP